MKHQQLLLSGAVLAVCLAPTAGALQGAASGNMGAEAIRTDQALIALAACVLPLALFARQWIGLAILLPWAILAPLETFYVLHYGRASDAHVLGILSETDSREALAYLGARFVGLGLTIAAAATLALFALRAARRHHWRWHARSRYWTLLATILVLLMPVLADILGAGPPPPPARPPQLGDELIDEALSPEAALFASLYPLGVPLRVYAFLHDRQLQKSLRTHLDHFRFGAALRQPPPGRRVHVLVIGETGRPDRWQLNGYARPTTPRLAAQTNLINFGNVISPWAWTRMAVPVILTRKPPTDPRPFFAERSLISAYREAGFRTYWLSTQSPLGLHDSSIALHAAEADVTRFINLANYKLRGSLDGDLLAPLEQVLATGEARQLIVLHTLGSHFNYSHRYPPELEIFRPSLEDLPRADLHDRGQRIELGNAYDNSVRYTDHFLAEVIARLGASGASATLFYVADHGENLFDESCTHSGHGHSTEHDFKVPAFLWYSDAYAREFPVPLARLRARRNEAFATTSVFPTLLALADIGIGGDSGRASLTDADWQPSPRLIQGGLDFDRAPRASLCRALIPPSRRPPRPVVSGTDRASFSPPPVEAFSTGVAAPPVVPAQDR